MYCNVYTQLSVLLCSMKMLVKGYFFVKWIVEGEFFVKWIVEGEIFVKWIGGGEIVVSAETCTCLYPIQ